MLAASRLSRTLSVSEALGVAACTSHQGGWLIVAGACTRGNHLLALDVAKALPSALDAHSAMESLGMVLSPAQLGCALLNFTHAASGLPWWASIPLAAFGVRTLLLPLSLRAKAASANLILLNQSLEKAKLLRDALRSETAVTQGVGMWSLARQTYKYEQKQQHIPALRWYMINAATQVRRARVLCMDW